MALPVQDQNLVGSKLLPVADLGLKTALTASESVLGTVFSTGVPGTVVVLATLASGAGLTLTARIDETAALATANIGSPTTTMAMTASGTKYYGIVDTTADYVADTSDLYVQVKQVAASTGALLSEFQILCLFELRGGEEWYCVRAGSLNAVSGLNGGGDVTATNPVGFQDGLGNLYLSEV